MTTPTCPHDSDGPFINTDRELWRETKDHYYSPSIHVTEHGGIGINVGGMVHVMGVRTWHALADRIRQLEAENARLREALLHIRDSNWCGDDCRRIAGTALEGNREKAE